MQEYWATRTGRWRKAMQNQSAPSFEERLFAVVRSDINAGALPAGALLPPAERVAQELAIEANDVQSAYSRPACRGVDRGPQRRRAVHREGRAPMARTPASVTGRRFASEAALLKAVREAAARGLSSSEATDFFKAAMLRLDRDGTARRATHGRRRVTDALEPGREPWLIDPGLRGERARNASTSSASRKASRRSRWSALEESSHGALAALQARARSVEEKRARERVAQSEALLTEQLQDMRLLDAQRRRRAEALEQMRSAEQEAAAERERALHEKLAAFQATELQLRRDRAELESQQQQLELDVQRRMDEVRRQVAEAARAAEAEKSRLREADLQKRLDDTLAKLSDTQRQLEQGRSRLQGEVLELLLEEQLAGAFRHRYGHRGQEGRARRRRRAHGDDRAPGQAAGVILWEAKRAQKWSARVAGEAQGGHAPGRGRWLA
ncbi:MAG: hypothetical protein MZW92_32805 [Comamonadaceae bacterium]|nr:hypothetical protein [Comamonadaceae bacterium]